MHSLNNSIRTISINELRRKFGEVEKALPYINRFIITKKGKPFATLSADPSVKKNLIREMAGIWKDTDLDNDKLWKDVLKRKSRRDIIRL